MSSLFLGNDPLTGKPVNLPLTRHALTIAGSGSGKGVCQITPNLSGPNAWPGSVVVVDPKGEAAERTAKDRQADLGQTVAVLDPFNYATGVDDLRRTFNPLDFVRSKDDIDILGDGLVMNGLNEPDPHWTESARILFKGVVGLVLASEDIAPQDKTLVTVQKILTLLQDHSPADPANKKGPTIAQLTAQDLRDCRAFGGITQTAAALISDTNETASFFKNVNRQLEWLASEELQAFLGAPSTVDLTQLKHEKLSLYLVIPPNKLKRYGRFLRVFVSITLETMWQKMPDGSELGTRCLFLLDEFPALGKMEALPVDALPQGRSYGLHIWPFCQYWNQLVSVYGREDAEAFIAGADAFCAFGLDDNETPRLVSDMLGQVSAEDVEGQSLISTALSGRDPVAAERGRLLHSGINRPRLAPDQVKARLMVHDGEKVPREMFVFRRGGKLLNVTPAPYLPELQPPSSRPTTTWLQPDRFALIAALPFVGFLLLDLAGWTVPVLPYVWLTIIACWGLIMILAATLKGMS